jgi:uncharacterized protein
MARMSADLVDVWMQHPTLFGTNYPMITPAQALAQLDSLRHDEEQRDLFLTGNARRVFTL